MMAFCHFVERFMRWLFVIPSAEGASNLLSGSEADSFHFAPQACGMTT
jgi:hypothetical protein